jgi:hypothetical protein
MQRIAFMQQLTSEGQQKVMELAQRYGVSTDAVLTLLHALVDGNGTMAQFDHRELGGRGQWMRGGMVMVGDMFNQALKATVDGLCVELSSLLVASHFLQAQPARSQRQSQGTQHQQQRGGVNPAAGSQAPAAVSLFVASPVGSAGEEWPAELGTPAASGAQNAMRYAYFPEKHRLAIAVHGHLRIYDTLDHQVSGVSQQQGTGSTLIFTSQHGVVEVNTLPVIASGRPGSPEDMSPVSTSPVSTPAPVPDAVATQTMDIFATLERLAELKQKGILSEEEFTAKKAELLRRI